MTNYRQFFSGKKITLMGLGLLGRGVGDAKFLAECGADLIVTDLKTEEQLQDSLAQLREFLNIKFVLGEHRLEDFRDRDLVIKAAGVPLNSLYIEEAKKNGVPVAMSSSLFVQLSGATIIGITGTRGKSTVTHLIYEILKQAGKKVWLGGNVLGTSTLALLPQVQPGDIAVLELDSWQLQGFGEAGISPHIAVFTNLLPDHLNYYGGSMEKYFADKANIFRNQKPGDKLFIGADLPEIPAHAERVSLLDWPSQLPGEHNKINIALAVAATRALGVPDEQIQQTVASFQAVSGRLELLREWRGIKIYNDTTATTPTAVTAALQALGGQKNIVLLAGGADKNLDMSEFVAALPKYCKGVVWLPGTGTDKLNLSGAKIYSNLKEAFDAALKICASGDILLLSPGFASFGLFKNEFDRGAQFDELVKNLA